MFGILAFAYVAITLQPQQADPVLDMTVTTTTQVWKEVLTRKRNATLAFATGAMEVDRNRLELARFLFLFR